ncbi:unnamed protein product [Echinostoma caproni]|uniref:DUF4537 domain-containing protein n=1 Tax=Echinostoma caproni TaxID=27848 RepID=A0A183A5I9_9TREM|nr:unnamed protein product [Echinostoma caproni]
MKSERDSGLESINPAVSMGFTVSPKVPLLYDSVTGAKDGNVISYNLDEQTISNRYVDLSHGSPRKLTFSGVPSSDSPGFHLEQNDGVGEKQEYLLHQTTGMRLFRPGDTALCAIHEDPSASIQLVAIPVVSTDGSYIPLAHRSPCTLGEQPDSCPQPLGRHGHISHSHALPPGFDPIALDSDADSGRGGSVNNIGLSCPLEGSVSPTSEPLSVTTSTPAAVHTLGVPVRYVSYTADGKLHMLTPPSSCTLSPQAVLVPISAVQDRPVPVTKSEQQTNMSHTVSPTCMGKDHNSEAHTIPASPPTTTTMPTSTTSPSRRHDGSANKKRDCGPWRLVQLPTQELEAEIQRY